MPGWKKIRGEAKVVSQACHDWETLVNTQIESLSKPRTRKVWLPSKNVRVIIHNVSKTVLKFLCHSWIGVVITNAIFKLNREVQGPERKPDGFYTSTNLEKIRVPLRTLYIGYHDNCLVQILGILWHLNQAIIMIPNIFRYLWPSSYQYWQF
jgi:hypothetical protein